MMLMMRADVAGAKANVQRARSLAESISRRERQHIETIALYINGEGPQSYAALREHLAEFPRDALLLRLAQRLFIMGCSSVGAGVPNYPQVFYALMKGVEPHYGEDWAFLGQYAWANHEIGLADNEMGPVQEGLRLAERSLELRPDNAIAAHSVAHVFFETGDHTSGGDFLGNWLLDFDKRATYRVHLSWHQALFELAMGRYSRALERYEDDIRPAVVARNITSLQDSASLLWRMHMYSGSPPPVPWEEVRDLAAPAAERPGPAFRDAHAALAFAASGDEVALGRMIDGLRRLADSGNPLAGEVTLPLAQGIGAFAHGAYDEAVRLMEPVYSQLTRIGGSHAQREVFEDTILEAYLRAGQLDKAEEVLRARLKRRPSVRDLFRLGRTQIDGGLLQAAEANLREVAQRWQGADPGSPELTSLNRLAGKRG
jgi:tetratricopeptide (TPR) repeat protein